MTEKDFADTVDRITEELKQVKPLTRDKLDLLAQEAHRSDPELMKLDKDIADLKAVNRIFEKGGAATIRGVTNQDRRRPCQRMQGSDALTRPNLNETTRTRYFYRMES